MGTQLAPIRGRPREFNPDEALAAALTVFWQRGYEQASMAELTRAMGITKPSLYACFGNKEALFRAVLDLYKSEKLSYIGKTLEAKTARGVAEGLLRGALEAQCGEQDPHGCLGVIGIVACGTDSIQTEIIARLAATENALAHRFELARDEGDLPDDCDPEALASYLTTVLRGISVKAHGRTSRESLQKIVDVTLAMWPTR